MKTVTVYTRIDISPSSGYVSARNTFLQDQLESEYQDHVRFSEDHKLRYESLDGYELSYLKLEVSYDGRKTSINQEDINKSLEKQGFAKFVCESVFGGMYEPTEKLTTLMDQQLQKRKFLAGIAS